ncbi:hypothetical protein Tco_1453341, partial [Tanacetum coccineum]
GRKAVTFNQIIKAKQWKRSGEGEKKGKTSRKEKPLAILMVQPWQRVAKQKITQTFSPKLVKIGDEEHSTSVWMNFMVVRSPSLYNGIIGRPGVRRIQAVPSTAHGMLKFPVTGRIVTLRSSRIIPLECTMVLGPGVPQPVINQVTE